MSNHLLAQQFGVDTMISVDVDGKMRDSGENADLSIVLLGVGMDGSSSEGFLSSLVDSGQLIV